MASPVENKDKKTDLPHEGGQFKKILKHSPWYLVNSLLTKAISFFLLPIYTKYLSPEDYGILANLEAFGRVLPIFLSLYIDTAFLRFYYKERAISDDNVQKLFSSHFWFVVVWGGITAIIFSWMAPIILADIVEIPFWPVAAVIITQLMGQLAVMATNIWRANLEAKKVAFLNIVLSLSGVVIGLIMLIPMEMGWVSRIYAAGCVAIVRGAFLIVVAVKNNWIVFCFDRRLLLRSLIYSIPLMPNFAAGWISGFSDRLILSYYGRLDEAGLYSVAYQFAFLLYVFSNAITMVQSPITMSALTHDRPLAKKKIKEFLISFFWIMSFLYLGLSLVSKEILNLILNERFHESYKLIPILGYIYVLGGVYRVFTNVVSFHNKTWIISSAAFLQVVVNVALNFSLIPIYGMYAAAWSSLVSLGIYTGWIAYWAIKLESLVIPWGPILKIAVLVAFIVLAGVTIDRISDQEFAYTSLKIILFSIFIIPVYKISDLHVIRAGFSKLYMAIKKW